MKLAVVGGGIAGVTAALFARRAYPEARIELLGEEAEGHYNRIGVTALFAGKRNEHELYINPEGWLEEERILTRFGVRADRIDPTSKVLVTSEGDIEYDSLILATGASPRKLEIPGAPPGFVRNIWTMADALKGRNLLPEKQRVTIVGAGVLGVEAALDLAAMGKKVTLVEAADRVMPAQLPKEAAKMVEADLAAKGIDVFTCVTAKSVSSPSGHSIVLSNKETILADVVFATVGAVPNTSLAKSAGLKLNGGISVDASMRTSHPGILACGNCAALEGASTLLWNPAKIQGEVAGRNAFENRTTINHDVWPVHLKSKELRVFTLGDPHSTKPNDKIIGGTVENGYRGAAVGAGGELRWAVMVGDISGYDTLETAANLNKAISEHNRIRTVDDLCRDLEDEKDLAGHRLEGWVCRMCGFTHEGELPPGVCPVCSVGRDQFQAA